MMNRLFILGLIGFTIVGCATQAETVAGEPPGFLWGLLHGFIAPFAAIGIFIEWLAGLLDFSVGLADLRIYAAPNAGIPYDLGYFLGFAGAIGGPGVRFHRN